MNNLLAGITAVVDLLEIASTLSFHATTIQKLFAKAQAEGRDLTDDELASARRLDDMGREHLARAIADKRLQMAPAPNLSQASGTKAWERVSDDPLPSADPKR
jgi:hypothetical protein